METSVHCFFNVAVDGSNQIERQLLNFFLKPNLNYFGHMSLYCCLPSYLRSTGWESKQLT